VGRGFGSTRIFNAGIGEVGVSKQSLLSSPYSYSPHAVGRYQYSNFWKTMKIVIWIVFYLCVLVAASSALVFPLGDANEWFSNLDRPSFAPPDWLFGPVWTLLYILIATSAYRLVQKQPHPLIPVGIALWALQLALNVIWTPVFSGAENLLGAFYYIISLWVTILTYIGVSWKVDRWASYLMVPYFLWVSFATVLNYVFWQTNM